MDATHRYPPGPWNVNAPIGLTWRHAVAYWWNPPQFFQGLARRYGDIAFFRLFHHACFLLNHPDLISRVLVDERDKFVKWPHQMRVLEGITGDSVLSSEGPGWVPRRKLLQRAFAMPALDCYTGVARRLADSQIATWTPGEHADLEPALSELLMTMTLATMFGDASDIEPGPLLRSIRDLSASGNQEMFELIRMPEWWPAAYKRRRQAARRHVLETVDQLFRSHSATGSTNVVSLLKGTANGEFRGNGMSPEQARDEAATMLIAGVHTTSAWLAWTTKLIAANPPLQAALVQELVDSADSQGTHPHLREESSLLDRTLKESLRLYPAAWSLFARQPTCDVSLGDYCVPRGSVVFIVPFVTQRDPRWYPNPLQFDPDRFLAEEEQTRPKGAYLPFGLGPHICIGMQLGTILVKSILESLLRNFELVPRGRTSFQVQVHLALRPLQGVPMKIRRRLRVVAPTSDVRQHAG